MDTFKKLMQSKSAAAGLLLLFLLYVSALFAEFTAPYHYADEVREQAFSRPTRLHFIDAQGTFHLRPFVYARKTETGPKGNERLVDDRSQLYPIKLLAHGTPYKLWGLFPASRHLFTVDAPAHIFIMGTDWSGRDIFSRIVYGGRISLTAGLLGVLLSFTAGMLIGVFSGLMGGLVDGFLMRAAEIFMAVPAFFLMLALRAAFPLDMPSSGIYLMIVCIMALIGWAGFARIVRGMTLALVKQDFIVSAKALGAGKGRLIVKHLLPNLMSFSVVSAALSIPSYILAESALSLLGLGINEPQCSWGNMLSRAMNLTDIYHHPWILAPGLAIFAAVLAFNLLGESLREALDPAGENKNA